MKSKVYLIQLALLAIALLVSYASGHSEPCVFAGAIVSATPPLSVQPTNPWFDALKPGTFTAIDGKSYTISLSDIEKLCANVNAGVQSWFPPIVKGHPATDSPREGSIKGARIQNGILQLQAGDLVPTFAEETRQGKFTNVSLSFFYPDMVLRHAGVLGAAKPAVTGLSQICFGAGEFTDVDKGRDSVNVVFSESLSDLSTLASAQETMTSRIKYRFEGIRDMFRKVREYLIDKEGTEKADTILPNYNIDALDLPAASFSEPSPAAQSQSSAPGSQAPADPALIQLEQRLATETQQRQAAEQKLQNMETEKKVASFSAQLDTAVKDGRMTPAMRSPLEALFKATVSRSTVVSFGEGDPKEPQAVFEALVQSFPKVISLSETTATTVSLSGPEVSAKISAFASEHKVSTNEAYNSLKNQGVI